MIPIFLMGFRGGMGVMLPTVRRKAGMVDEADRLWPLKDAVAARYNLENLEAEPVGLIYRYRWQIELFSKVEIGPAAHIQYDTPQPLSRNPQNTK